MRSETPTLLVEFFGIHLRERAGRMELKVPAGALGDVLTAIQEQCPRLKDLRDGVNGAISRHYRLSLDGQRFLTDLERNPAAGSHVLILSADVGG